MRKQGPTDGNGDAAPAAAENGHRFPQVQRVTVLPSSARPRATVAGIDVVVTTKGSGTFLIHRKTGDHPRSRCPLLRYEIRRIDADVPRPEDPACGASRGESTSAGSGCRSAPTVVVEAAVRHPRGKASEEASNSENRSLVHVDEADTVQGNREREG